MKKKKIKIALAQIKIEQKNIEENCKKIFKKIEEAAKENVDIVCFPELATIGYTITAEELKNLPEDFENTFIEKLQETSITLVFLLMMKEKYLLMQEKFIFGKKKKLNLKLEINL